MGGCAGVGDLHGCRAQSIMMRVIVRSSTSSHNMHVVRSSMPKKSPDDAQPNANASRLAHELSYCQHIVETASAVESSLVIARISTQHAPNDKKYEPDFKRRHNCSLVFDHEKDLQRVTRRQTFTISHVHITLMI